MENQKKIDEFLILRFDMYIYILSIQVGFIRQVHQRKLNYTIKCTLSFLFIICFNY